MAPRWLVVAPDTPIPPDYGGRVEVHNMLATARAAGIPIDLVATVRDQPSDEHRRRLDELVDRAFLVRRNYSAVAAADVRLPFQAAYRRLSAREEEQILRELRKDPPEAVIAHLLYTLPIAERFARALDAPLLLRSHNVESRYCSELAKTGPLHRRAVYAAEAARAWRYERAALGQADGPLKRVLDLSTDDAAYHGSFAKVPVEWLPPFLDAARFAAATAPTRKAATEPVVLYVGSLFMPNNAAGLAWFVRQVWPAIRQAEPRARLRVVGRGAPAALRRQLAEAPGVEHVAYAADLGDTYAAAAVFVNPIFHGSGVNLKNVDALAHGVPLVTTPKGARGLPWQAGRDLFVAGNAADFAVSVARAMANPTLAEGLSRAGRTFVTTTLNPADTLARLRHAITASDARSAPSEVL